MCIFIFQALDKIPLIRAIINWVINFIVDSVAPWIIERGGWVSFSFFSVYVVVVELWFKILVNNISVMFKHCLRIYITFTPT